ELGVQGVGREELRGRMVLIRHSLNQARTVLHDLLDIPVKHEERSQLDVNSVIEDNLRLLGHHLIGRIKVRRELEQLPSITAGRSVIDQVVFNLLRNGVTSTPNGGRLLIKTYAGTECILIEVADSGEGIAESLVAETISPAVDHTGEGLPNYTVAHRLVNENGGSLSIDSKLGYGTLVRVRWPLDRSSEVQHPLLVLDEQETEG
ncbi:MAG: ATP-binding protein, partial [Candidatus Alcyoniella australis]|nr:ATP-binding protein [Candidatus Alcyoniella australis]